MDFAEIHRQVNRLSAGIERRWRQVKTDELLSFLTMGATGVFLVRVISAGVSFAVQVVLARLIGTEDYGIYMLVWAWIGLLVIGSTLGLDTLILRYAPAYQALSQWADFRGLLIATLSIVLGSGVLIGIMAALAGWAFGPDEAATAFALGCLALPLTGFWNVQKAFLQSLRHVVLAEVPEGVLRPLLMLLVFGIMATVSQQAMTVQAAVLINLCALLAAVALGSLWFSGYLPEEVRQTESHYDLTTWIRTALPLLFLSGMGILVNRLDIIMLGWLADSREAGIYSVASRLAELTLFGLGAANGVIAPSIARLYHAGRLPELQRLIGLASRGVFAFTVVLTIFLIAWHKPLLVLFGQDFTEGAAPLLVLLAGQVVNALAGSVGLLMVMTGQQDLAAKIFGAAALLNGFLDVLLIPIFGAVGAAIATALSIAFWNIIFAIHINRKIGINATVFGSIPTAIKKAMQ